MRLILNKLNPWWNKGSVPGYLTGKPRNIFDKLEESLDYRQITIISGMRRVGKTTLIFQLINHLITNKNTDPYHIIYFSFD